MFSIARTSLCGYSQLFSCSDALDSWLHSVKVQHWITATVRLYLGQKARQQMISVQLLDGLGATKKENG